MIDDDIAASSLEHHIEELVQAAVLAERQRCADIAGKEANGYRVHGLPHCALGALQVQKAILVGDSA